MVIFKAKIKIQTRKMKAKKLIVFHQLRNPTVALSQKSFKF